MNTFPLPKELLPVGAVALLPVLGACASGGSGEVPPPSIATDSTPAVTTSPQQATTPATGSIEQGAEITFTFDYGGKGSTIIQAYPGPTDSAADRKSNGTFPSGETHQVDCHTLGREINGSRDWYRLAGTATVYYATGGFGRVSVPPGATLKEC